MRDGGSLRSKPARRGYEELLFGYGLVRFLGRKVELQ
jgi:hypothetical protein